MDEIIETIVIGAGPAGLTGAYTLAKHGRDVLVLEQDETYVGGISRTASHKGFLFDIGGHRFFSKSKEIVDLWNELLPDDFLDRPRLSRIYYREKFYAYPLKAFEALKNLGVVESALCVASYAYAKAFPVQEPRSFHQWVRNQFGERLFGIFFKTYTEKVWGMSCDDISADWAAQRIKGLSLGAAVIDGLKRSLRRGKRVASAGAAKTLIESFRYPRRGPGMMWEAAARKMQKLGGRLLMGRKVEALAYDESARLWTVSVACADGTKESHRARHILSSAPLREVMNAIEPKPLSLFNARALSYRDFLTVVLIGRPQKELPDNWVYIHDPSVKVGRVQNFKSWSPEMIADGVSTCLGLEYFCFEGDGLWNAADADLVALAKAEIGKIGLMNAADVYDACVVRQPKAYPVYDESYAENVKAVRLEIATRFPTLHPIGRNGMHKYNNQDHAMMTGMLTALNIVAGRAVYDVWGVNEDAEYTEQGVSGAQEALASERLTPKRVA
ncbi:MULTISPECIES: NAD(P)/FAD-dependent oxidoreductase [Methylosinus]|uniref:FAD-dependent oxidoreductase n=1 Tax=Methylosinus trichosporium (strain ATCC 35070 / NCIMB 11131 / UNIQEM 75 / OB3b) TaxID=595536 RepID=A0A2D2D5P8_METT3|nr:MULTISPECIES: NAD(P)/FAD-dependent oxidoreductase [Methylosinus]ATQ70347.1 FAD-dependent oxidoreductase [Methylosinus trichosporium OB3b]OBS51388.1 FAD-dependent oxidoreductase [Methylosinus sp. 3S-1]